MALNFRFQVPDCVPHIARDFVRSAVDDLKQVLHPFVQVAELFRLGVAKFFFSRGFLLPKNLFFELVGLVGLAFSLFENPTSRK